MRMSVAGSHVYTVRIPDQLILDPAGNDLEGYTIESRRLILISRVVESERREEILIHELQHAWEFHVPPPTNEEQRAQLTATIMRQFRLDLESQGGIPALMNLPMTPISLPHKPAPVRKVAPEVVSLAPQSWECGFCRSTIMMGSVEGDPPVFYRSIRQHVMQRWFRCDVCGTLTVFHEIATADGIATGQLIGVPAPKMLTGPQAQHWLALKRALAAGV